MSDWEESLTEQERAEWQAIIRHSRENTIKQMDASAFVMTLVPEEPDIKFMLELGMAIMLDKPIIALATPTSRVPDRLRLIADRVIEVDFDTEKGREEVARAIHDMVGDN